MVHIIWINILGFVFFGWTSQVDAIPSNMCRNRGKPARFFRHTGRVWGQACRQQQQPRKVRIPRPYRKVPPYPGPWWRTCKTMGLAPKECYEVWRKPSADRLESLIRFMIRWLHVELQNTPDNACHTIAQRRHYYFMVKKPRRIPRRYRFSSRPWWWDRYRGPQQKQYQMVDAVDRLMQKNIHLFSEQQYQALLFAWSDFFYNRAMPMETEVAMVSRLSRWLQHRPNPVFAQRIAQTMQRFMLRHRTCPWWYIVFMGTYAPDRLIRLGPKLSEDWCELRHDFKKTNFLSWKQIEQTLHQWSRNSRYRRIFQRRSIGCSAEGRKIWAYRLGYSTRDKQRPTAVLVGNQHGDEHVGADLLLHWTRGFLQRYEAGDKTVHGWLHTRHLWIIPVLNPDGKVFDMLGGVFKWWRFNRGVQHDGQIGVDLNRNFSYAWRPFTYSRFKPFDLPGTHPFSEPETRALRRHLRKIGKVTAILDVHQSGSVLLMPYAHQWQRMPEPYDTSYQRIGKHLTEDNRYRVMQARRLYPHAGTLGDWGFVRFQALSLVLELGRAKYLTEQEKAEVLKKNHTLLERFVDLAVDPFQRMEQIWQKQQRMQANQSANAGSKPMD